MPWRIKEDGEALEYEVTPPQMVVDVEHNFGRPVVVKYYDRDGYLVDVATELLDDNNVRVSAVNFIDGYLIIL